MASTRKGGKKASKVAKSGKAAAAKSSKAAAATKASKATKYSKKAAGRKGGSPGGVTHPPVIVTDSFDGSSAIKLVTNVFRRIPSGGNTRVGKKLRLLRVEASREHTGGNTECIAINPNESAEIKVSTRLGSGGPVRSFTITGANSNDPATSLVLEFDHIVFPPLGNLDPDGRRIFRNLDRTITSLEITTSTGRTHDCSAVTGQPGLEFTIHDDHVDGH